MRVCIEDDCLSAVVSRGMCRRHYAKDYAKNGPLKPHANPRVKNRAYQEDSSVCSIIPGCPNRFDAIPYRESHKKRTWCCTYHGSQARRYGLSSERIYQMEQVTECELCHEATAPLYFDHDHTCCPGKTSCGNCVRGKLCNSCNLRLSKYEELGDWTKKADAYLESH